MACACVVGGCSDDGVPQDAGTEGGPAGSASASDTAAGTSGGTSAVTTADAESDGQPTDPGDTTVPTGVDTDASATDGTTDGGTTTGESAGESGGDSSGGSSTTGGTTEPECVMDEDCMLVDDCCSCTAIPVGDEAPECDIEACLVSTCTSLGLGMPAVQCNFGTCEVEEVSCDPTTVVCKDEVPTCPKGQAPRVVEGCWDETCVPVEYCDVVPGCESCGDDEACIESVAFQSTLTCVPVPAACDGVPSCDCLGEACEDGFDLCADAGEPESGADLSCSCPAC